MIHYRVTVVDASRFITPIGNSIGERRSIGNRLSDF